MPTYPGEAAAWGRQLTRPFAPLFLSSCGSDIPGRVRGRQVALPYPGTEENVVPNGRRAVRRGVARRNAKLTARRELVSPDRPILAVDLAPGKQATVACDHDSVVLGRRVFTGPAWCIEQIVAEPVAARAGFAGLVLACETARHRWEPRAVTARAEANL